MLHCLPFWKKKVVFKDVTLCKLAAVFHDERQQPRERIALRIPGALRTFTSADGSAISDRLETRNEAAHQLRYSLLTDKPFRNCLTTMTMRDLGPNRAEMVWSATFERDGIPACEAAEILEGALSANSLALQQFMER